MTILKLKDARELPKEAIDKKLSEIRLELAKELGKIRVGGVAENPGKIKDMKKVIARILTIENEKKISLAKKPKGGIKS
ncbi:MAG: 50S ribosomal protein L29 [Nanoarchaeota archaeon]|nr:50S ribosomal protein L29 [Nanoarchaeota archaeon]MBU4452350.1 50S ribosomal protein L29 [Nanoarchaeota archaeon]MCG2723373.1 50S ribosomal protein L29 [archaeon]